MVSPIRRITPHNYSDTAPGLIAFFADQRDWLEQSYPALARIPDGRPDATPTELVGRMIANRNIRYYEVCDLTEQSRPTVGIAAVALNAMMWHGAAAFGGVGLNYALHETQQGNTELHDAVSTTLLGVAQRVMPKMRRRTFQSPHMPRVSTYDADTAQHIHLEALPSVTPDVPRGVLVYLNNDTQDHAPVGLTEREEMVPIDGPSMVGYTHASAERAIFRLGETTGQLYFEEYIGPTDS